MNQFTNENKSKRLFLLFFLDLFSTKIASIILNKNKIENPTPFKIQKVLKINVLLLILVSNIIVFIITVYFTSLQNSKQQLLWLKCILFWLFLEFVIIDFLKIMYIHIFLNLSIIDQVDFIKLFIYELLNKYNKRINNNNNNSNNNNNNNSEFDKSYIDDNNENKSNFTNNEKEKIKFNFYSFFFISRKIASKFRDVFGSKFILLFSTEDLQMFEKIFFEYKSKESNNSISTTHKLSYIKYFF
jgi:hypothetical protein